MSAGVYIHIPFCKSRCSYCDFATDVYRDSGAVERYVEALCREIEGAGIPGGNASVNERGDRAGDGLWAGYPIATLPDGRVSARAGIDTIYFGGGTPSLLQADQLEHVLNAVRSKFNVDPSAEITMEMNPATVTAESLAACRALGVNRASFGVQTFNERDLKLLARGHDANDARVTFRLLREAGFDNVSFDLIAGLPGQSLDDWRRNLDEAVAIRPEHLSLYLLEVHEGTPLAEQLRSGRRPMPDEDLAAEMYETMIDTLASAGYEQYEISNFSLPGYESRHNNKYWRLEPVYGFGVSAHSFDGYERYSNERDTAKYVERVEQFGGAEVHREGIDEASETAFLGLRLSEGIDLDNYEARFGVDLRERIDALLENGLVETESGRLRLTRKGMLFSNEVFAEFV
jgi:oxygen-independent coproporphyrinogen III oxidase